MSDPMTVRDALEKQAQAWIVVSRKNFNFNGTAKFVSYVDLLAPIVEKAARDAYLEGWYDRDNVPERVVKKPEHGVAAFVAVLTEEKNNG